MSKVEILENKVMEIIKGFSYVNKDGGIEIYTDYRDRELSRKTISDFMNEDNPRETFQDILNDWAMDYSINYGEEYFEKDIKDELTEKEIELFEENSQEIWDMIRENTYFYYDENDFNNDIEVNIMVDCGNRNYDYSCDNVLNWYGNSSEGIIPAESSMLWLAKTQGKATALRKACKQQYKDDGYYVDRERETDKFIESCIQEFENLSSNMGTVTFLVKMKLFQLFDLIELQKKEYDEDVKYDHVKMRNQSLILYLERKQCVDYMTVGVVVVPCLKLN